MTKERAKMMLIISYLITASKECVGVFEKQFKKEKYVSPEHKTLSELRTKPVSSLTNEELAFVNNRLNLEMNFNRLNPSKIRSGKVAIQNLLNTSNLGVSAYKLFTSPTAKSSMAIGKKFINKD